MCARTRACRPPVRSTIAARARTPRGPESACPGPAEASRPVRRSAPTRAAELSARSRRTSSPARSFGRGLLLLLLPLHLRLGGGLGLRLDLGLFLSRGGLVGLDDRCGLGSWLLNVVRGLHGLRL